MPAVRVAQFPGKAKGFSIAAITKLVRAWPIAARRTKIEEDVMRPYMRLRQICLVARDLERAVDDLTSVFDIAVCFRDPMVEKYGLANAVMPVGSSFLEVVSPIAPGTAAGRFLDRRGGDAGYMVINDCEDNRSVRARAQALGIRVVEEHAYPGKAYLMQLHPRDSGGCILEFDHHVGGESLNGAYAWAGDDWHKHVRTTRVHGLAGVELRSAHPAQLAARWSAIYARALGKDRNGAPRIDLDNAHVSFLQAATGADDALTSVQLVVRDAQAIMQAAAARGLAATPDAASVTICGVSFRLIA